MKTMIRLATVGCVVILCSGPVLASDTEKLTAMLQEFLAAASEEAAHASFWAEDLVYTSSAGLRFGKADIMAGFAGSDAEEEPSEDAPYYFNTGTFLKRDGAWQVVAWQATKIPHSED